MVQLGTCDDCKREEPKGRRTERRPSASRAQAGPRGGEFIYPTNNGEEKLTEKRKKLPRWTRSFTMSGCAFVKCMFSACSTFSVCAQNCEKSQHQACRHYGFRARLFTRVRPYFFTELSMPKALRKLSGCCSVI